MAMVSQLCFPIRQSDPPTPGREGHKGEDSSGEGSSLACTLGALPQVTEIRWLMGPHPCRRKRSRFSPTFSVCLSTHGSRPGCAPDYSSNLLLCRVRWGTSALATVRPSQQQPAFQNARPGWTGDQQWAQASPEEQEKEDRGDFRGCLCPISPGQDRGSAGLAIFVTKEQDVKAPGPRVNTTQVEMSTTQTPSQAPPTLNRPL